MLAPIVLFAYNRPEHLRRTLASLQANGMAEQSELFVYCDGPKQNAKPEVLERIESVRELARSVSGFWALHVVEHAENQGLATSVINGVSDIMARYGRAIVLEDDLQLSPHFLRFMNEALARYEHSPSVFSIGGYTFPPATMPIPKNYAYDTYLGVRCCSWGWATWADRWDTVDWGMTYFDDFVKNREAIREFERGGPDLPRMLAEQYAGYIDSWAIRFCFAHCSQKSYCLYPVRSLVNNLGLDNSGQHCQPDPKRQHQGLPEQPSPWRFCPEDALNPELEQRFRQVFSHKPWPIFRDKVQAVFAQWQSRARRMFAHGRPVSMLTVNIDPATAQTARRLFDALAWPDAVFMDKKVSVRTFKPQIVHLNSWEIEARSINELMDVDCPIVWTLHDAWPFTGGCHNPGECLRYCGRCGQCPALNSKDTSDTTRILIRYKEKVFSQLNLTIVASTPLLAQQARQSGLFKLNRIELIPWEDIDVVTQRYAALFAELGR